VNKKSFDFIKKIFLLVVVFIFASSVTTYAKVVKKELEVQTKDSRIIKATLSYVNIQGRKKYPTVILLHSLGYTSSNWGNLIPCLNNAGYAVIAMDLRGHGKSVYDAKFHQKPWRYFTPKAYKMFPGDVLAVMAQVQKQYKKADLNNFAIVGADIGANTAILAASKMPKKPKTMVLISPTTNFKGLYTPLAMVDVGAVPVLAMASNKDGYCLQEEKKLSKFAQGGFYALNYPQGGMGMMMLKVNPSMAQDITKWIIRYLK
jgi:pimeloyl-ACP methyl ester carboxylesterase